MRSETLSGPHTRGFPIPPIIERPLAIAAGRGITVSAFKRVSDLTPMYKYVQGNTLSIVV